ncbi:alpha-1,2-fucosyltransferase [Pseudomonadota bacterium]
MIISRIIGGLGNQMFQYAAARSLAIRKQQPLFLDASDFTNYALHRFELTRVFDCPVELASNEEMQHVLGWRASQSIRSVLSRSHFGRLRGRNFLVEPHFEYWPELFEIPGDCYLVGYWQSEKYFIEMATEIRRDFTFKSPLAGKNLELSKKIEACNSISLHIRRGDYVTDAKTKSTLGVCSLGYYRDAIAHLVDKVSSPCFFVFSDDISWAKAHLGLDLPCTYIDHNHGEENYRDMQLMSLCRHNIIANSSFSWWGAWLNPHSDKIVIAPKRWFASQMSSTDLVPLTWTRL